MPNGSAAAVVTDPPWNLDKDYGGAVDDRRTPADYNRWLHRVMAAALRVAHDSVVVLPGAPNLPSMESVCRRLDVPWRLTLWWRPPPESVAPPRTLDIRAEPVVWLRHGPPAGRANAGMVHVPLETDPYLRHHPCPKPVALFRELIARCVTGDGAVVDPFAGTGSSLIAACELGRPAVGYEASARFHRLATERIRGQGSCR